MGGLSMQGWALPDALMKGERSTMSKENKAVTRKDKLAEWEARGARWCAEQLWNAKKRIEDIKEEKRLGIEHRIDDDIKAWNYDVVKKANYTLKCVLEEAGIFPTKLTLFYRGTYCEKCPSNSENGGDEDSCGYCNTETMPPVIIVKTLSFYTYKITDGDIEGITTNFEDGVSRYECFKIVNEKTGEVLYEASEEEED